MPGVRRRRWRVLELEQQIIGIAVVPVLARFERSDYWMGSRFVVGGGVPSRGVVATSDVATLLTDAQMHPVAASRGDALHTTGSGWFDISDLVQVRTGRDHGTTEMETSTPMRASALITSR